MRPFACILLWLACSCSGWWQQCRMPWLAGGVEEKACYSEKGWDRAYRGLLGLSQTTATPWLVHCHDGVDGRRKKTTQKNKTVENRKSPPWTVQQIRRLLTPKLDQTKKPSLRPRPSTFWDKETTFLRDLTACKVCLNTTKQPNLESQGAHFCVTAVMSNKDLLGLWLITGWQKTWSCQEWNR